LGAFLGIIGDPFPYFSMSPLTKSILPFIALGVALSLGSHSRAAEVGAPAPDFTLTDLAGTAHKLSDYRGKIVVLEWVNPECPIVQKHYNKSGNIPRLQQTYTGEGVVWLSINSAAPGKQGDYDAAQIKAWMQRVHWSATDYFRDQNGDVGHLYGAKTTPHIFIINRDGTLVYAGGIDSIASSDPADIAKATNYVAAAMADLQAGRPVAESNTRPYGCSVKY
jgi:glutathione peroxidase-family protein